jgi:hypothetical protein
VDINKSKNTDKSENDITKLKGFRATEAGFGIDMGLGHVEEL